jgi:hypothetical protein
MRLALDFRIRNRSAFLSLGGRMQSARSVSVPAIFLVRQTKKSRRLAGAARLISVSRETAEGLRRIGRLRFMFGAVVLSFGLLALAMLNLLRAPLDRCLASSRLFSVCCRFVRTLLYCKDDRAVVRLIAIKLDSGNAITFRKEL